MTATATQPRKPRPRRIAADEAHAWARNLRLGNPHAKLVMSMLTLYVNSEGVCFVSIPSLADDCEIAASTVRSRLAWLETVGAITRFPQWIDGNGVRNSKGQGKRTTDEIRLMLEADADLIEAKAHGVIPSLEGDSEEANPPSHGGLSHEAGPVNPPSGEGLTTSHEAVKPCAGSSLGLRQPFDSTKGLTSEPEPELEDSPLTPQGGTDTENPNQSKGREVEGWTEFVKAFTADEVPILRMSLGEQLFDALKPNERALAIEAAKGLIVFRKREKKPGTKPSVQTFLREPHAWPGFAKLAPAKPRPMVFIAEGSAECEGQRTLSKIGGWIEIECKYDPVERKRGYRWSGGVPVDLAGLARFANENRESWIELDPKSHEHAAWIERIFEWTGARPNQRKIDTLRVPCAWPPRKDGTLSGEVAA